MKQPLLSLVVPTYNTAAYLPGFLECMRAQTLVPDEIIMVDDGSTDECPAILAEYCKLMPNLRVIRQENGGVSAARNAGLEQARGKWVAFPDTDDHVAPDMYARLVAMGEADELDIALCNAVNHFEGREPDRPIYSDVASTGVISGRDWLRHRLTQDRLLHMVWMHLYRRDFLDKHQFRFVPGLIHQDVIWTVELLLTAQRVRFDATALYSYRVPYGRYAPATKARRLLAVIDSSVFNARTLAKLADRESNDPALKRLLDAHMVDGGFSVFHKLEQLPPATRWRRCRDLRREGYFGLLWRHAVGLRQRRRITRNYLVGLLAGIGQAAFASLRTRG